MNRRAAEFAHRTWISFPARSQSVRVKASIRCELLNVDDKAAFAATLQANYNAIYTSEKADMASVMDNVATIAG